jgi:hypothetical protein
MSKSQISPVPPAARSTKGPKSAKRHTDENAEPHGKGTPFDNLKEQGQQASIGQNTTARGRARH